MITFLLICLGVVVVMYVGKLVIDSMELDGNIRKIAMLILGLICLVGLIYGAARVFGVAIPW